MTTATRPGPAEIEAARLLLGRMGITPQMLIAASTTTAMPTFAEYIDRVHSAVPDGSRRTYGPYWRRVRRAWGERRIDEPTATEIRQLVEHLKTTTVPRRNGRGGRSPAEHAVAALRCLYRHAIDDGLIATAADPAARVAKPTRLASTRRALPDARVAEILHVAATTGNDPDLDTLLLRLHLQTACRRGGALALRLRDLDEDLCLIRLEEKGETVRWQPVTPSLMRHLVAHAHDRCATRSEDRVLRYRTGTPITHRRYDHLWERLGRHLAWVATQQVSTHWLRHTTLTWVERHISYAIARAYAGHTSRSDAGTTATYVRGQLEEVAAALAMLTGEAHPLATRGADEARFIGRAG